MWIEKEGKKKRSFLIQQDTFLNDHIIPIIRRKSAILIVISSRSVVIPKIVVPMIFGGFAMLGYVLVLFFSDAGMSRWFLLFPTMPLLLALLVWRTVSKYADEVVDAGDSLLVRRGSVRERVQLSDILEVRARVVGTVRHNPGPAQAGKIRAQDLLHRAPESIVLASDGK